MAYAFNDDKSKCGLNGVGVINIPTEEIGKTIEAGGWGLVYFSTTDIKYDDVLGILAIMPYDKYGKISFTPINFVDFYQYDQNGVTFKVCLHNATNDPITLGRLSRIKVRTLA